MVVEVLLGGLGVPWGFLLGCPGGLLGRLGGAWVLLGRLGVFGRFSWAVLKAFGTILDQF